MSSTAKCSRRRTARIMLLGCGSLATLGASEPPALPPRTLLLLVAGWCAPCRGELQRIESIADAASPWNVRVVPVDDRSGTRAMLRPVDPRRVLRSAAVTGRLMRDTGGLPFSAMTDAAGRVCAMHDRPLDAPAARDLRRRCGG